MAASPAAASPPPLPLLPSRAALDAFLASASLDEVCSAALAVRALGPDPLVVTFSPKVFVPLTRACRDACGYCTFAADPAASARVYMTVDEVVAVAERGRVAGATECLFTLGDRPEARYEAATRELAALGFASTVDYLAHCAEVVMQRTGLIPHCNAGVLTKRELARLRQVSASQGLMLESTAERLMGTGSDRGDDGSDRGDDGSDFFGDGAWDAPHRGCESKRPAVRLEVLRRAGELRVPFTSGVLVGIGETRAERLDALFAIRAANEAGGGHVGEVIVQNFRAKEGTRMAGAPEPDLDELVWTAAAARLILGPDVAVQVPPNLTPEPDDAAAKEKEEEEEEGGGGGTQSSLSNRSGWRRLLRCGVSDWGGVSPGVTPDHVSPEAPWPRLDELARVTAEEGYALVPRLAAQPRFARGPHAIERWLDPNVASYVRSLSDADGMARGSEWCPGRDDAAEFEAEASSARERRDAKTNADADGADGSDASPFWRRASSARPRARDVVGADGAVFGGRDPRSDRVAPSPAIASAMATLASFAPEDADEDPADAARASYASASAEAAATLLRARGADADAVYAAADARRRETCGDVVSYVVNRNINYTNVCELSCSFCAFSKGKERELDEFGDGVELRGKPYLLDLEEVSRRAAEAWARGATEVCMQGGIHPSFTGETYVDLIRAAKAGAPDIHVHAFSPLEVTRGAETYDFEGDLSGSAFTDDDPENPDPRRSRVRAFLRTLRDAGLGSLPGTAAEILDDDVRAAMCPDKITAREWLEVVSDAHRVGLPTTSTLMFGHVDADDNWARARHLVALRDQHARSLLAGGVGFTEFVPLPFVHFEAPAFRRGEARRGPTLRECLLAHAVARLALAPAGLANVQASWVKMGPELAGRLLEVGCNDLGGTLMNESITRAAGARHGQEMSAARLEAIAKAAGREVRMRNTLYGEAGEGRREAAMNAEALREFA